MSQKLQPLLANVSTSIIRSCIGVSRWCASRIRQGYSTQYERQLYIVYDLGFIRDEEEFKRGLEDAPGVSVLIIKH
jgi:hypothetical protein